MSISSDGSRLDLSAYLRRIGLEGAIGEPDLEQLRRLQAAHLEAVPFENFDQRLGRPVLLDLASLQDKIVRRRRGGYCFEQNTLFAAVLRQLGYRVECLEARVRPLGASAPLPRTHMLLRVEIEGRAWLADVGFGVDGPFYPVPFAGETVAEPVGAYQIVPEGNGVLVLRGTTGGAWRDLYAFRVEPVLPVDFEIAHYYTATHPTSKFRQTLTVQRSLPKERHRLRGRNYECTGASIERRADLSDDEVCALINGVFELEVPIDEVRAALAE
jgi:N-hydroxyarylamine O-acetyltransferase